MKKHPNRFNGVYGAAVAADRINNREKANSYYRVLKDIAVSANSTRPELQTAMLALNKEISKKY